MDNRKRKECCTYCDTPLKQGVFISKDNEYLYDFCSGMCSVRHSAEMSNQVLLQDIVIDPFTKNGNYSIDIEWDMMLGSLERYQKTYRLNLDPDFQRAHVWTEDQQISFVEYLARGGYAGKEIYFNYPDWMGSSQREDSEMVIVDGKQRLQAAMRFLNNEIKIFGKYYAKDLYRLDRFLFSFKFYINSLKTRKEVLKWYLDLNSGGTPHTSEEIEKVREMLKGEQ